MKIVHIVEAFGGGVYTFLNDLTENDSINDHYIIFSRRKETPNNIHENFIKAKMIELPMKRQIDFIFDLKVCMKLNSEINKINPDIIHLHSSKAGVYGRLINFLKLKKISTIYNPHGLSFLQINESKQMKMLFRFIEKSLSVISKATIVGVSKQEYEVISKRLCSKSAVHINNGVKEFFEQSDCNSLSINYDFVIIGRICKQKNPELFNKIATLNPEKKFLWIGDGEDKHILSATNIEITGWVTEKVDLYRYLKSSKIYIQLSLWEGLPIALLEAMSIGLPCLVTDCIGLKEVIEQSNNGQIISYDLSNWDNAIKNISENYNVYSYNSISAIKEKYSVSKFVKEYQNLYRKVSR